MVDVALYGGLHQRPDLGAPGPLMGRPELAEDDRFRSERQWVANRDEIHELVGEWTASHPTAGLVERMNEAGVPCSRIYSIADIFEAPQ